MAIQLLAAAAATASASNSYAAGLGNRRLPITFIGVGITGADYITLQISHDNGATWADIYYDGVVQKLTITNTVITVYGPGLYRGVKTGTTGALFVAAEGNI